MTTGTDLIHKERDRQISEEGWTLDHDDNHASGELALAAACYAVPPDVILRRLRLRESNLIGEFYASDPWPWDRSWDKRPSPGCATEDRIRALAKAGALIAAEIDRLHRLLPPDVDCPECGVRAGSPCGTWNSLNQSVYVGPPPHKRRLQAAEAASGPATKEVPVVAKSRDPMPGHDAWFVTKVQTVVDGVTGWCSLTAIDTGDGERCAALTIFGTTIRLYPADAVRLFATLAQEVADQLLDSPHD